MRHGRLQPAGRNAVLVIGLVIGVLVMHGLGDRSMDHSGLAMAPMPQQSQPAGMTTGVSHGHDLPGAPAGEMAMAAICAFAVLLLLDGVSRRNPQPIRRWAQPTVVPSRLVVGPEPPVHRLL
jgi:hypothetical protein